MINEFLEANNPLHSLFITFHLLTMYRDQNEDAVANTRQIGSAHLGKEDIRTQTTFIQSGHRLFPGIVEDNYGMFASFLLLSCFSFFFRVPSRNRMNPM